MDATENDNWARNGLDVCDVSESNTLDVPSKLKVDKDLNTTDDIDLKPSTSSLSKCDVSSTAKNCRVFRIIRPLSGSTVPIISRTNSSNLHNKGLFCVRIKPKNSSEPSVLNNSSKPPIEMDVKQKSRIRQANLLHEEDTDFQRVPDRTCYHPYPKIPKTEPLFYDSDFRDSGDYYNDDSDNDTASYSAMELFRTDESFLRGSVKRLTATEARERALSSGTLPDIRYRLLREPLSDEVLDLEIDTLCNGRVRCSKMCSFKKSLEKYIDFVVVRIFYPEVCEDFLFNHSHQKAYVGQHVSDHNNHLIRWCLFLGFPNSFSSIDDTDAFAVAFKGLNNRGRARRSRRKQVLNSVVSADLDETSVKQWLAEQNSNTLSRLRCFIDTLLD